MRAHRPLVFLVLAGAFAIAGLDCTLSKNGLSGDPPPVPTLEPLVDATPPPSDGGVRDATIDVRTETDAVAQDVNVSDAAADADASTDAGADACSNTINDSNNCGSCGHSCLGGACTASRCLPVPLAVAQAPQQIAVSPTFVYWTSRADGGATGTVSRIGKDTIGLTAFATGQTEPFGVTTDGNNVYWANSGSGKLRKCPHDGGCTDAGIEIAATGATTRPTGIAVDPNFVYYTATNEVGAYPLDGGLAGTRPLLAGSSLAVDTAHVYYVGVDQVARIPKSGAAAELLANSIAADSLAIDAIKVFWTQRGTAPLFTDGVVTRASLDGGSQEVFANGQLQPRGIAVDATHVYWTNYGTAGLANGSIMRCPISGTCMPETLAAAQGNPLGIALDATAIYWVNELAGLGAVYRLAK